MGSVCVHSIESMFCRTSQSLRTNLREHAGCRIIHPRERTLHLMQQAHTENRVHALWNLSEAVHEFQRSQSGLPQDLSFPWPAAASIHATVAFTRALFPLPLCLRPAHEHVFVTAGVKALYDSPTAKTSLRSNSAVCP